jgi:cyclase
MENVRLIARLDIKGPNLIKGVHLEGLRVIGSPYIFAKKYFDEGIDEIILMDVVASLYGRNQILEIVQEAVRDIFIPITLGGGIRSLEQARQALRSGADKVAINTAAVKEPKLISRISEEFGSQSVVSSIEAKRLLNGTWEVYFDNGRERTGIDVVDWARTCASLGAGEILLTSVDQEGTRRGFDVELVKAVTSAVQIPVIASGGMGNVEHLIEVIKTGEASAVAMADILHYGRTNLETIRNRALEAGLAVRRIE